MVRDFNDHLKFQHWVYEEKKLKCKHCNFGPSSKYVLDMHVRDLHPRGYTCYSCGKTFRNLFETSGEHFEFVKHLRSAHGLTNYFCHQCGFETDRIIKFATHEHVQHMWQFPQPQQKSATTCDFEVLGAIITDTSINL